MQLAGCSGMPWTMRPSIDMHGAGATNTFTAIVIKSNWILPFLDQSFIQYIKHFKERHFRRNIFHLIGFKPSFRMDDFPVSKLLVSDS